jgi:hypothetical protein
MKNKFAAALILIFILLNSLPVLYANYSGNGSNEFGGFIFNPIDGNSYLAKMREGWNGSWQFYLPFTAFPGSGTLLFPFYILLGHIARWINIPIILLFHLMRILAGLILVVSILFFLRRVAKLDIVSEKRAFPLIIFGSGMGWLLIFGSKYGPDFWVAEAYPFLSAYANPHFPLGLAIFLGIFILLEEEKRLFKNGGIFVLSILLSIIFPFAFVLIFPVLTITMLWQWIEVRKFDFIPVVSALVGGAPYIIYQYWISNTHPVLLGWNSQNITLTPPIWELILSFSPGFFLAILGIWSSLKSNRTRFVRLIITWFVISLVLVYFPINLQRRFVLGLYIPVGILAVIGFSHFEKYKVSRWLWPVILSLSFITNLLVISGGFMGASSHNPNIYLTKGESNALTWLDLNCPKNEIVMAGPEMGLFIPAHTKCRVLYGHPYETINAEQEKKQVITFYLGDGSIEDQNNLLKEEQVRYIFLGPREEGIGIPKILNMMDLVYQEGGIKIFSTGINK